MISKLNPVSLWLVVALVLAVLWAGIATWLAITASSRCDTRIETAKGEATAAEMERSAKADRIAAGIFDGTRRDTAGAITGAAGNTHTRETVIREVRVTGACIMPKGLPSLAPAVEEARRAAND